MSIIVMFEARCQFCPAIYSMGRINVTLVSVTKHQFVKQLRAVGWKVGKYITCPDCAAAGKQHKRMSLDEYMDGLPYVKE